MKQIQLSEISHKLGTAYCLINKYTGWKMHLIYPININEYKVIAHESPPYEITQHISKSSFWEWNIIKYIPFELSKDEFERHVMLDNI